MLIKGQQIQLFALDMVPALLLLLLASAVGAAADR